MEGCIKLFLTEINIGWLLHLLWQNIPATFQKEFTIIHWLNKIVKLEDDKVFKYYPLSDAIIYLKTLYKKISETSFIELLEYINMSQNIAVFKLKGIKYRPWMKKQLIKVLCYVLTMLKVSIVFHFIYFHLLTYLKNIIEVL